MTYSVIWSLVALQAVTHLEQVDDPVRIRAAQDRIDWALRRTPRDVGESRFADFRIWYEDVLGVYDRVDDTAMRVEGLFAVTTRPKHTPRKPGTSGSPKVRTAKSFSSAKIST